MKIGIDICEISRIKSAAQKSEKFLEKIFTDNEIKYFSKSKIKWESVAGNFAVKEAFSKYLGTGIRNFKMKDIELLHNDLGAPYILFNGKETNTSVSISHSGDMAIAVICGEAVAIHDDYIKALMPKRDENTNKTQCGRVFILGGSKGMTGAATLCAMGALRSGAGLVTVGTAEEEREILAIKLTEAMTVGYASSCGGVGFLDKEKIKEKAEASDVFVIGMGMGRSEETAELILWLIENVKTTMVIDADGLNALARNIDILRKRQYQTILTPHEGEMAYLCGKTSKEVKENRKEIGEWFAKEYGAILVLKGKNTLVCKDDETFVNPTGNEGMATGGSGDVLAGVIGSFCAQGLNPYDASVLGVYVHGRAGDISAEDKGKLGLIASDITENIPYAVKEIYGE